MGHGLAQVFAQAGYPVMLQDVDGVVLEQAEDRIRSNLALSLGSPGPDAARIEEILSRITRTPSLAEAVAAADFVMESVSENLELKIELFQAIEFLAPAGAILASNTSLLRISDIGKKVKDRKRLVVAHWFNPPYFIPVVEVVRGPETSLETWEQTIDLLKKVGKSPIRVLKEVPGHLVNRIQFALLRETLSLLQDGVAEVEEIDQAISGSLGLRLAAIGPLRGMDLSGLEIFWYGMENMHKYRYESPDPRRIVEEKIKAGHVGRKAGRGFYTYETGSLMSREEMTRDRKIMELLAVLHHRSEPVDT
jgi:3-hydroxybutyryl-CoA dehydrogenase